MSGGLRDEGRSAGRILLALVGLGLLLTAAWQSTRIFAAARAFRPRQAADALPLYLASRAWESGLDPADPAALRQVYVDQGLDVYAQLFSTLYPPSAAAMLVPLTVGGWLVFLERWRPLLLVCFVFGAAAAGAGGGGAGRRLLGAGLGAWLATCAWPLVTTALGLGQANLLVSGVIGLALGLLTTGRGAAAGVATGMGAGVKLVPALLVWPLAAGRRLRALAAALGTMALLLVLAASGPGPGAVSRAVWHTIVFQGGVVPAWSVHPERAPFLVHALAAVRHLPLGLWTLAVVALALEGSSAPAVVATGGALCVAWLGADAAGVGVFYALLGVPAAAWLLTWPLARGAPRWSWAVAGAAFLPWLLMPADVQGPAAELAMAAALTAIWAGLLLRFGAELPAPPARPRRRALAFGAVIVTVIALGRAVDRTVVHPLPPPPADGDARDTRPDGVAPFSPHRR